MADTQRLDDASKIGKVSEETFIEQVVTVWAKAVDTQMHFNEMSVKSRQLGLTFVAASLALAVFLFTRAGPDAKYSFVFEILNCSVSLHVAVFIVVAAAAAVYAVKVLDLGVYHKMLRGAVTFGEDFEERYLKQIFPLAKGMTQSISHFSRHEDAAAKINALGEVEYSGIEKKTALDKISRFYWIVIWSLLIAAAAIFITDNLAQK